MLGLEEDFELSEFQAIPELLDQGGKYALPTEYLSWSQMNLYMSCGERYRRRYVEKQRTPSSSNLGQGRLIHKVVENMNLVKMKEGRLMEAEEVNDMVSSLRHEFTEDIVIWDPKVPDMEVLDTTTRELVELYRQVRLPETRPKAVELRIGALLDGEVPYVGFVDLLEYGPMADPTVPIVLEGSVPRIDRSDCVTDLKATGKKYGSHRIENAMQLTLYAEVTGVDNVAFDLLVQKKENEFVRQGGIRTPSEKQHAKNVAKDIAQGISAGYFPRTEPENWMCTPKWCDYYDQCRGGKNPVSVPVLGLEE